MSKLFVRFPEVRCGVLDGTGCGRTLENIEAEFIGISLMFGKMVDVYKILEPFYCSSCGRSTTHVYVNTDNKIEVEKKIALVENG